MSIQLLTLSDMVGKTVNNAIDIYDNDGAHLYTAIHFDDKTHVLLEDGCVINQAVATINGELNTVPLRYALGLLSEEDGARYKTYLELKEQFEVR